MTDSITAVVRDGRNHPPVRLDYIDTPRPAPDEALLDVHASTINRGELALLASRPDGWRPGQDVAGVVVRAAEDESGPAAGARVLGTVDGGAWATQVAARTNRLAVLPEGVPFEAAAALGIAGLTALRVVLRGGSLLGRRVLVTGARGGVGHLAVQLAALGGARVTSDDVSQGPFDIVVEGVGGKSLNTSIASLEPGGTLVLYGVVDPEPAYLTLLDFVGHEGARIITYFSYAAPDDDASDLAMLAGLVADGCLKPRIARTYRLEDIAEAVTALRDGTVHGKVALKSR